MTAPLYPPKNVGRITYTITDVFFPSPRAETRTYTADWPYFAYDTRGRNALQRQAMSKLEYAAVYGHFKMELRRESPSEMQARTLASAIQNALDKFDRDAAFKASADRKAANDAAYAAMVARNYAQMNTQPNAPTATTAVVTVSNPITPPIKPFTTNTPTLATKVVVITAKPNSQKSVKNTPKKGTTTKQSSPGKGTPNKNPSIPKPPPQPPDIKVIHCLPGTYFDAKTSRCEPCPVGRFYIKGSGCQPCPPGTTGESIHTGCSHIGPDGKSYTFIA